jgi:hypothetical protein
MRFICLYEYIENERLFKTQPGEQDVTPTPFPVPLAAKIKNG